jgi:hypothetical protein
MCTEFVLRAIHYGTRDQYGHYIKNCHTVYAALNSRKARYYKHSRCYLKFSSQKIAQECWICVNLKYHTTTQSVSEELGWKKMQIAKNSKV